MSARQYALQIQKIVRETPDAVSIHFRQPDWGKVSYTPGQFLTLILTIDGEKVRRSYSMSSCPYTDETLSVTVKRIANGKVSSYINEHLKEGDWVDVMEPAGTFTLQLHPVRRHVIILGAGSGITPLMSVAKAVLRMESASIVSLLYGNRNEQSVIFKAELEAMQQTYPDRFRVTHVLSQPGAHWRGQTGRLNRKTAIEWLRNLPQLNVHKMDYYVCGPAGMMDEMLHALDVLHVPREKIHRESFVTVPSVSSTPVANANASVQAQEVTVIYEGTEYKVRVSPKETILQAGLDQGIDLPYSCQSGLCTACRGKCLSGQVKMDESDGLTPEEVDEGYVLTCVGHPLTPDVVIEIE